MHQEFCLFGSQIPEVYANPMAVDHVEQLIEDLDAETERLILRPDSVKNWFLILQ